MAAYGEPENLKGTSDRMDHGMETDAASRTLHRRFDLGVRLDRLRFEDVRGFQ
jgi:hypothetical protein